MAVVQVARETNTLEDKKKEYLYKYNDLLKALREEILLWALMNYHPLQTFLKTPWLMGIMDEILLDARLEVSKPG